MQTFWNLDTSQKRKVCIYGIKKLYFNHFWQIFFNSEPENTLFCLFLHIKVYFLVHY